MYYCLTYALKFNSSTVAECGLSAPLYAMQCWLLLFMQNDFLIEKFGERMICLKGVGKMFYQEGFPISIAVSELKKKGVEVSILHVADECLKNGWSAKTTYNKLKADFEEDIDKENKYNLEILEKFCWSDYESQREMIFQYLFGSSTNDVRNGQNKEPLNWLRSVLQ